MIIVARADPQAADNAALIAELDLYLASLYPAQSNYLIPPIELAEPEVFFVVARNVDVNDGDDDGDSDGNSNSDSDAAAAPLGCGALKRMHDDGDYGEIKRVYVRANARRQGAATRIICALEQHARQIHLHTLRLETGVRQPQSIELYQQLGYQRRPPFGAYPDDKLSVFMEKRLSNDSSPAASSNASSNASNTSTNNSSNHAASNSNHDAQQNIHG